MPRFVCFLIILSAAVVFGEEASLDAEVRQLVKKLGDKSYVVRQRAEAQLLRTGAGALAELQRAKNDKDIEIAKRAEDILARYEMLSIGQEDGELRYWITQYALTSNVVDKAGIIWLLASPFFDAPNGEGQPTLCRIVRFDSDYSLRAEAAKCLMALPPPIPSKERKWFRAIREAFTDPGDDYLLQLVTEFAQLRCDLDDVKDATEKKAKEEAKQNGTGIDYPVPLNVDNILRDRVLRLTDRIAEFQSKPENSAIQAGNFIDILLFYALAELQDLAGLTAERDRAAAAALKIRTESLGDAHPLALLEEDVKRPFYDHYAVGRILKSRYRLHWALQHYKQVNEESGMVLQIMALKESADTVKYLEDYAETVRFCEKCNEIISSDAYKAIRNDSDKISHMLKAEIALCHAQEAFDKQDWNKALEYVKEGLGHDPREFDILILAHRLGKQHPDLDQGFRNDLQNKINEALYNVARNINRLEVDPDRRGLYVANQCNQAAWLLAGTDGDYRSALTMIEITMKAEPEECGWIDTLGYVYFLGKEYDKAVEAEEEAVRLAPETTVFRSALTRFREEQRREIRKERKEGIADSVSY